jgi:predicted metal-dependent peptidase
MDANEKLVKARVKLLLRYPFFGQLALGTELKEEKGIPTAATDGRHLMYNPRFIDPLSQPEATFLVAHEISHIFLLHHTRRGARDPNVWNQAADYVINLMLKEQGFVLISSALLNPKFKDWNTEKVYNYLIDNPEEQQPQDPGEGEGQGDGEGQPTWNIGGVQDAVNKDGSPMSKAEIQQVEAKLKGEIQNAISAAKKAGNMPAGIERLVSKILAPKANWREILKRFVTSRAQNDWDWGKCHTRMLQQYGIVTPVLDSPELGTVFVGVDTSGSISDKELQQFGGELSSVLENYSGTKVIVAYCDSSLNLVEEFEDAGDLVMKAVGGGGTLCVELKDYFNEKVEGASCFIYMTDGYVPDILCLEEIEKPVLIACTESRLQEIPTNAEVVDIS